MKVSRSPAPLEELRSLPLKGGLFLDETSRLLYSTDASEYQEKPLGVAMPEDEGDLRELILWAGRHGVGLIPRTAGTSLAGQCVGSGLVVDVSKHFTRIISIDTEKRRVRVQPGVIRNELNLALRPHGLLFGPETSTANRAMIGGMVGNNSCGSNSIVYGSTRDRLLSVRGFLSDGSEVTFGPLDRDGFMAKCEGDSLEARLYRRIRELLSEAGVREEIRRRFPKPSIPRRNTGYAVDLLMDAAPLDPESKTPFNFCKLIAGSEGTLFFAVEIELRCDPLPPPCHAVLCAHFASVDEALRANLVGLAFHPSASELIDRHILECSRHNPEQARNRSFVQGDPGAILALELRHETEGGLDTRLAALEASFRRAGLGYAYPVLKGSDSARIWDLRRAGQGVINNVPGDVKPREVIEDTAVAVEDLPAYIAEMDGILREKYGIECVYYGHAATGEIHARPYFEIKSAQGLRRFREIATDIAALVKKYRGSLSGEHGDGRLRGEFVEFMVGARCHALLVEIKRAFDPRNLFNPGKIVAAPPMDTGLRHTPGHSSPAFATVFDFSETGGMLGLAEKCNGVGECRKTALSGGTMCPSYMATREEKDTTRGRANLLRNLITERGKEALTTPILKEALDLCLSCKACKSECPSNVDMAKLKGEFLQAYHDKHGIPWRSLLISHFATLGRLASFAPWLWNAFFGKPALRRIANRLCGFHPERTIPPLSATTLRRWFRNHQPHPAAGSRGRVYLFCDEFTNFNDAETGIKTVELMEALGYRVELPPQVESGRAALSKGFLRRARALAAENVRLLHPLVCDGAPLVGIEPSALLSFRDEYPALLRGEARQHALELSRHCYLVDEFLVREHDAGRLPRQLFPERRRIIRLHGHCHQKAIAGQTATVRALELVPGHDVRLIASGCCGMAGSFGYEAEHFALSQQIGELVLFPTVRVEPAGHIVCAPGTSCRHQIHDATARRALHPAEILHSALFG